jgi:galactofuranosylgalactofuranosylrhamnosyl-N-acetylglucosaminyl-diphospho-decaprenol beta-1,5/1,6-galactofuranosyltransferase
MSLKKLTLQRLRFYDMDPGLIAPNVTECIPRFDLNSWKSKGSSVYWQGDATGLTNLPGGMEISEGNSVSADTFFNSFFLAYWLRLTRLKSLSLQIKSRGKFRLDVILQSFLGESQVLLSREIKMDGLTDINLDPSVLSSGLRLSFTLTSSQAGSQLLGGGWQTEDLPDPFRLGIVLATFGRNAFAERVIQRILSDVDLQNEDYRIVLTDQNKVSELHHLNQERCRVVNQDNLGCAGGLTRAIYESLYGEHRFEPTHLMFIDDDVDLEADSILRSIRMMQFAKAPFILGGIMLDLYRPNRALCHGENFTLNDEHMRSMRRNFPDTDIADANGLNAFSIPSDFDYTAGWFCVYPAEIYGKIGFQMPFFIQGYEDAEFCLRARKCDYTTYTIPGIGVWHLPFYSKAEAGWRLLMANYHQLIHHSLYGYDDCSKFFFHIGTWALTEIMQGRYRYAAALVRAMENFLEGWNGFIGKTYPAYLQEVQAYLLKYDAEQKSVGKIHKAQVVDLKKRLEIAVARFEKEGKSTQSDLAEKLPATFTMDSWKHYFAHGNLTSLSS